MLYVLMPDKYLSTYFSAVTCCIIEFVVYNDKQLIAYVISGLVVFARNCNLPISLAYKLLLSLMFLSGLDSSIMLGLSGIPTAFVISIYSFCRIDSR
jgi:hypothetical protein